MRITRSKSKKIKGTTDENKESPVLTAKTRSTGSRRQYLSNISNINSKTDSESVTQPNKRSVSGKMRTLAKDEVEVQAVAIQESKTDEEPIGKRKNDDFEMEDETENVTSPLKKFKGNMNNAVNEAKQDEEMDIVDTVKTNNAVKENGKHAEDPKQTIGNKEGSNSSQADNELSNNSNAKINENSNNSNFEAEAQPKSSNAATVEQPDKDENSKTSNGETIEQPETPFAVLDEQPSTSKAALARLANIAQLAHNIEQLKTSMTDEQPNTNNVDEKPSDNSNTVTEDQPSPSKAASSAQLASGAQFKSLRRLRSNPSLAETNDDNESTVTGDTTKPMPRKSSASLPDKLLSIISNLYLNAAERLKLDFPPRCAEDLEHCHQHHYRAPLPPAPDHTQANNLRCALQQQRYLSFVSWSLDMCHRGEFPGESIFTKIIEIVLSFNSKSSTKSVNNNSLGHFFNKSIELFTFIVRKFPPCWLTLRQFYINFFQTPLDASKLSRKNEPTLKSNNILEILLDLLETTLEKCTEEDLQKDGERFELPEKEIRTAAEVTSPQSQEQSETILNSECLNMWDWEEHENRMQTFEALQSPIIRLERLFIALQLLLHILESDFVMWILHHHKKAKDWIFCDKNRPLIVLVLALSKYSRSTGVVKHLFTLFSVSVNKRAKPHHLKILERYISLAVVASNVADMEYSAIGVRYPNLGAETKSLIHEFFVTFKAHNTSHVSSYLNTIEILRIPFVRSEFIDYFLQLFYFPRNEGMSPKKIAFDISKKRWLKYKPQAELNADDDDLSREHYLHLLLTALMAYCEWHGSVNFFQLLTKDKTISSFKAVTDSVHRYPTNGSGTLMLHRMRKDIAKLEKQLRMEVRVSKPKVDLPIADICIDQDVVLKYRTDLKFLVILNNIIAKQSEEVKDVDYTTWKAFLANFSEG